MIKKRFIISIICFVALTLLLCIIYGYAADQKIQSLSTQNENYQFSEEVFKQKYNTALQLINEGIHIPKMKETNLEETDFVVMPLDKAIYGQKYFVLLPIEKRGLTGKEMLILASRMREIPAEQILQDNYAKKDKFQNRPYTYKERILEKKLMSEYFYLGKTPKRDYKYHAEEDAPLAFGKLGEPAVPVYWIYPMSELNEEQMLQVIDKKYQNMDKSLFTPSEKEISYDESINTAKEMIKKFNITLQNVENYYPLYNRGSLTEDYRGLWFITVETTDSRYIQLEIDALEGTLNKWILLENEKLKKATISENVAKKIVEEYVRKIIPNTDEILEIEPKMNQQSILEIVRYDFKIRTKNNIIIEVGMRNNEDEISVVTIISGESLQ